MLLCETAVCLLQVQLIGTNVWLLQNAQHAPCRWFRVLKNTCKIGTHMCEMDVGNESDQAFVTSFIPFGANMYCTDHKMSGLLMRAKYEQ